MAAFVTHCDVVRADVKDRIQILVVQACRYTTQCETKCLFHYFIALPHKQRRVNIKIMCKVAKI